MIVPVVHPLERSGDPVELLASLARGPFAFLLESAAGNDRWSRYTILGTEPREVLRYRGNRIEQWTAVGGWRSAGTTDDPIGHFGDIMRRAEPESRDDLPPFWGGAVGFLGYDLVGTLEKIPPNRTDDLGLPDAVVMIVDAALVLDRQQNRASIVVSVDVPETACAEERQGRLDGARQRAREMEGRLFPTSPLPHLPPDVSEPATSSSPTSDAAYMDGVRALKDHIAAGDIFQGVLSRRLDVAGTVDALTLYRCMRAMNPAPYLYYLALDGLAIVGGSPEVLVRVERGVVTLRPIAGTRPRGATPDADAALAAELLADPKECAEHRMLVDLGRNDVGRVADYGSVRVADNMVIERYTHVMHIVSEVQGRLAPGRDAVDALKASFPAGTVSGAPKVRAMELLAGLEPVRRGPYAGAVGYLGWGATSLDTAITIRTCVVLPDRVAVQAGAGIVADSDPATELAETRHKARGALRAVARARQGRGR